jgi:phage I-like protein
MNPFASEQIPSRGFSPAAGGTAPEWIELIPPGKEILGRDGRFFVNADPSAVVEKLRTQGKSLVVDYDHATELKAPKGEESPAAGWVDEYEIRDGGSIWGRVSWTPRGRAAVLNREYRYLSPVILYSRADNVIRSLGSMALTNSPNLNNTALNHAAGLCSVGSMSAEEKRLCEMMGVSPEEYTATKQADFALNAQRQEESSADVEKMRRLMGVSEADIQEAIAQSEKEDQATKLLTADELKVCAAMGVDPLDYWNERVRDAGLDPEKTTFSGYKYDNKGTRL